MSRYRIPIAPSSSKLLGEVSPASLHFSHVHMLRGACGVQTPGLSPSALFSSVFFNQLAANLKNATNLLQQLKSENASLVVNTNGPREAPASVTQQAPVVLSSNALVAEVDQFAEPYSIHGVCLHGLLFLAWEHTGQAVACHAFVTHAYQLTSASWH